MNCQQMNGIVLLILDSVVVRSYLGKARHGGRACSGSRYSSLLDGGRLPAGLLAEGEALGGEAQVGNTAGHHLLQRVEEAHRGSLLRSLACSETSKLVQTKTNYTYSTLQLFYLNIITTALQQTLTNMKQPLNALHQIIITKYVFSTVKPEYQEFFPI